MSTCNCLGYWNINCCMRRQWDCTVAKNFDVKYCTDSIGILSKEYKTDCISQVDIDRVKIESLMQQLLKIQEDIQTIKNVIFK